MTAEARRLVYVTVAGCAVCREKAPVVEEIADELGLPLERVDRDTDEGSERADALRIRGVPTLALVEGDRVPFRLIGRKISRETVDFLLSRD